jgi:hypothetical protein
VTATQKPVDLHLALPSGQMADALARHSAGVKNTGTRGGALVAARAAFTIAHALDQAGRASGEPMTAHVTVEEAPADAPRPFVRVVLCITLGEAPEGADPGWCAGGLSSQQQRTLPVNPLDLDWVDPMHPALLEQDQHLLHPDPRDPQPARVNDLPPGWFDPDRVAERTRAHGND